MVRKFTFLSLIFSLFLSSCQAATVQSTLPASPTGALTPYLTPTVTQSRPTATIVVTIPVTPSPTPTPFLHTITNDDTLLGLAIRYGVKLDDLKAANPNVNPNAMSVGTQLVIPIQSDVPQPVSTPTAIPVSSSPPVCYPSGDGGVWCVLAVHNDQHTTLENLSIWIGLYDLKGENFVSQVAYAPLNILRPASTMPLMAYFSAPLPEKFTARAEILSAYLVATDDTRYLDARVKADKVEINTESSQVDVTGRVTLPAGTPTPSQVWVLAVAYDAQGNILGVRKWKSAGETSFDTTVYSLAGKIDHVDVLAEVRP